MGLFKKNNNLEKRTDSRAVIDLMLKNADTFVEQKKYVQAIRTYKQILELQPDITAMYNLGSLYAQGKGAEQNFLEGAYWFHQANLAGDEQAGKLCTKCMMDYVYEDFGQKTAKAVFDEMLSFVSYLYPREDQTAIANDNLYRLAGYHMDKKEYDTAAKFLRAAAEFGNHGSSQNYLAVLYNAGTGVEQDDLVSLYWFDRAVDNRIEIAHKDRDGLLNAYHENFSAEEFYNVMQLLIRRCNTGDADIPRDTRKAAYWRKVMEKYFE